jgi:anti-anti-sigma regulatory factor
MNFKTDTKEKFIVISVECNHLTANLSEELFQKINETAEQPPHNVILKLEDVKQLDREVADGLAALREVFYDHHRSFVVCCLQKPVLKDVVDWELEDDLNVTLTESEAWDIVQMDEIERELTTGGGEDID